MSKLGTALAFFAGAAVGGGSVWYVLKARYEEISEQDKQIYLRRTYLCLSTLLLTS